MTDIPPADPIAAVAREAVLRLAKSCGPTRNTPGTVMEEITLDWHFFQRIVCELELSMKAAGRAEASAWRPISECPENLRIYVYGWHRDHEPPYDEEAMAWKDQIDGKFYYAPQGGVIDWTPTHFAELMGAPLPPPPEGGE